MEYISNDEVYGKLRMVIEHGGGAHPLTEFQLKCRDVAYEVVVLHLSLRKEFHLASKKGNIRSIRVGLLSSKLNRRNGVKTKRAENVPYQLLDIRLFPVSESTSLA
jgi:hypothetical protein